MKIGTITTVDGFTELYEISYGSFSDTRVFLQAEGGTWEEKFEQAFRENGEKVINIHMDKVSLPFWYLCWQGMEDLEFFNPDIKRMAPRHIGKEELLSAIENNMAYKISSSRIAIEQSYARVKAFAYLNRTLTIHEAYFLKYYAAVLFHWSNEYRDPLTK